MRISYFLIVLTWIAVLSGCEDGRTAFEAFVECNDEIKQADSKDEALACFSDASAHAIRDKRYGTWLQIFQSERPRDPRLFRAVEVEGATQLLIIDGGGPSYARHIVRMERQSGRWRIGDWSKHLIGFSDDSETPAAISLRFEGAVTWTSEDLVAGASSWPRCDIHVSHVFDVANVHFPVRCELMTQPGEYAGEQVLDPNMDRGVYVSVEGSPNIGVDESRDLTLTVKAAPDGRVSGAFRISVTHPEGDYTVDGAYTNLPFEGTEK